MDNSISEFRIYVPHTAHPLLNFSIFAPIYTDCYDDTKYLKIDFKARRITFQQRNFEVISINFYSIGEGCFWFHLIYAYDYSFFNPRSIS